MDHASASTGIEHRRQGLKKQETEKDHPFQLSGPWIGQRWESPAAVAELMMHKRGKIRLGEADLADLRWHCRCWQGVAEVVAAEIDGREKHGSC